MRPHWLRWWFVVGVTLALPLIAYAQDATLSGTVTDTTGGALPGVTVRAVHEASGNHFETVTDERGAYRLPVRVGVYRMTAELGGFAPFTRTVTLLLGQEAVVNLEMSLASVEQTLTVSAQAPLLALTDSSLGGNIDPRQMAELPLSGRNWMELTLLARGARAVAVTETPGAIQGGGFQTNFDGQQVTSQLSNSANDGQPRFSRDAIEEFEFLSNRFDATQGRSAGLQVNVITKSGTNTPSGTFAGYFRRDRWKAADFVVGRVLPFKDQQLSATYGGPIVRNKLHFFAHYDDQRQPQSFAYSTPYPHFNRSYDIVDKDIKGGVKLDGQLSPRTRLMVRAALFRLDKETGGLPTGGTTGTSSPGSAKGNRRESNQLMGTLTQVLTNRAVNEIKAGYGYFVTRATSSVKNPNARFGLGLGGPEVLLRGFIAGGIYTFPEDQSQKVYSLRDDFSYVFNKGGRHAMKLGAEHLYRKSVHFRCTPCEGSLDATGGPVPSNLESIFPDIFDASTWNLAPLSPITLRFRQQLGGHIAVVPRNATAAWLQDDWSISSRLTLNLGVRYDLEHNAFANDIVLLQRPAGQRDDTNNLAPRLGVAFTVTDRTVLRGGYGVYYGTVTDAHTLVASAQTVSLVIENDGRPDFAINPYNGPTPTLEQILPRICGADSKPGCIVTESIAGTNNYKNNMVMPYSHQASVGVQRQLGDSMSIEADYVYEGSRKVPQIIPNVNVTYNPATGANYPFEDVSRRPWPWLGVVTMTGQEGVRTNTHSLQTAFTKRFSQRWQASATYLFSPDPWTCNIQPTSGVEVVPFAVAADLGGECGPDGGRLHRAVFNGIWELPYGFQASGLYFYTSTARFSTNWGTDVRRLGTIRFDVRRLRPNGTIVSRDQYVIGDPLHRVDLRLQRKFQLRGRTRIEGILEVFNAFNHANYGGYVTNESSSNYGRPRSDTNNAFQPRSLQLGFRFAF